MFNLILGLAFLGLVAVITTHAVVTYKTADGTWWERTLATSRDSATWLYGKLLLVAGLLIEGAYHVADFLNMPDVSNFIHERVPPSYLGWVLVGIAALTFIARARTLLR